MSVLGYRNPFHHFIGSILINPQQSTQNTIKVETSLIYIQLYPNDGKHTLLPTLRPDQDPSSSSSSPIPNFGSSRINRRSFVCCVNVRQP